MTDFRSVARRAAQRHGLDPNIFERQIQQESGFNPNARSPAGATGIAQFMPATARGLGINPDNPGQALDGAARLMASYVKKYGSYKNALVAYNAGPGRVGGPLPAETQNYVKSILRGSNPRGGAVGRPSPGVGGPSQPGVNAQNGFDPGSGAQGLSALLAAATAPQQTGPPVTLRPAPAFAASAPMPAGYQGIQASAPPAPKPTVDPGQLQALVDLTLPKIQQPAAGGGGGGGGGSAGGVPASKRGTVLTTRQTNRPGVGLSGELTHFVSLVSGRAREPITITTGTNHNRLTVDGNVSDHWDGHAADVGVPVDSAKGDHIASAALQAAGVPKIRAMEMARQGGLFNVNYRGRRVQVIWKTYAGGNHHNHVHIGIR